MDEVKRARYFKMADKAAKSLLILCFLYLRLEEGKFAINTDDLI